MWYFALACLGHGSRQTLREQKQIVGGLLNNCYPLNPLETVPKGRIPYIAFIRLHGQHFTYSSDLPCEEELTCQWPSVRWLWMREEGRFLASRSRIRLTCLCRGELTCPALEQFTMDV